MQQTTTVMPTNQTDVFDTGVVWQGKRVMLAVPRVARPLTGNQSVYDADKVNAEIEGFRKHMEMCATIQRQSSKTIADLQAQLRKLKTEVSPPIHCLHDDVGESSLEDVVEQVRNKGPVGVHIEWIIYHYEDHGYEGSGTLIARLSNGRYLHTNMGHCSCYGPLDDLSWGGYEASVVKTDLNLMGMPSPDQVAVTAKWREVEPEAWK